MTETANHLGLPPALVAMHQTDTQTGYKINGSPTWLPMPDEVRIIPPFTIEETFGQLLPDPDTGEESMRELFYGACAEYGMHTLAYSFNVMVQFSMLAEHHSTELVATAIELWPSNENTMLGRYHGRLSCYQAGCRGPLCTLANREANRKVKGGPAKNPQLDNGLAWLRQSYEQYILYVKGVRYWRSKNMLTPAKARSLKLPEPAIDWSTVTLARTILLDITPETQP